MTDPTPAEVIALKACPFCGGEGEYIGGNQSAHALGGPWMPHIRCKSCGAKAFSDTEHSKPYYRAIAAWNTRPAADAGEVRAGETADMVAALEHLPELWPARCKLSNIRDEIWLGPDGAYAISVCGPDAAERQRIARAIWVMLRREAAIRKLGS